MYYEKKHLEISIKAMSMEGVLSPEIRVIQGL